MGSSLSTAHGRSFAVVATGTALTAVGLLMSRRRRRSPPCDGVLTRSLVEPLDLRLGLTVPLTSKPVKWLFLGAGRVAHDYANALKTVKGAQLHAVATRNMSGLPRCQQFQALHGFAKAFGSYEEALTDPEVDVVYLSAMHSHRVEHVTQILQAGKHAVVEKPFACCLADARSLFEQAKAKNLFLMEGMWTRFFPAVEKAREIIEAGAIGAVTAVLSDFGFDASDIGIYPTDFSNPRDGDPIYHPSIGGGALLWAGPYPISAGLLPFDQPPDKVVATGVADTGKTGIELSASIALSYSKPGGPSHAVQPSANGCLPRGAAVSLFTSVDGETREQTAYVGQRGRLLVDSPGHCPTKLHIQIKRPGRGTTDDACFVYSLPSGRFAKTNTGDFFNYPNSAGFAYEAAAVMRCILAGLTECPQYTTEDCLRTMQIIETARNAIL